MFEVKLDKQPIIFLKKCEKYLYYRILEKLKELKKKLIPSKAKRVVGYGKSTFRIRIGKYRILYRINYDDKLVIIVKIDRRDRVYSRS